MDKIKHCFPLSKNSEKLVHDALKPKLIRIDKYVFSHRNVSQIIIICLIPLRHSVSNHIRLK